MRWTSWIELEDTKSRNGRLKGFGVYEIRIVGRTGSPIPIHRLVGTDRNGVIYIGRSGFRSRGTGRTIANRIREFDAQYHSGGITYAKAQKVLRHVSRFLLHRL